MWPILLRLKKVIFLYIMVTRIGLKTAYNLVKNNGIALQDRRLAAWSLSTRSFRESVMWSKFLEEYITMTLPVSIGMTMALIKWYLVRNKGFDMYFVPSANLGSQVLIYKNYKFWMNNRLKNRLSWACSNRKKSGCTCRVLTSVDGKFLGLQSGHNHAENWDPSYNTEEILNVDFKQFMTAYNQLSF